MRTRLTPQRRTFEDSREGHDRRVEGLRTQQAAARDAAIRARDVAADQMAVAGRYDSDGGSAWVPDLECRLTQQAAAAASIEAGGGFLGHRRAQLAAAHAV
jgi:hypothetical protein